jgi:hypothetical protein
VEHLASALSALIRVVERTISWTNMVCMRVIFNAYNTQGLVRCTKSITVFFSERVSDKLRHSTKVLY